VPLTYVSVVPCLPLVLRPKGDLRAWSGNMINTVSLRPPKSWAQQSSSGNLQERRLLHLQVGLYKAFPFLHVDSRRNGGFGQQERSVLPLQTHVGEEALPRQIHGFCRACGWTCDGKILRLRSEIQVIVTSVHARFVSTAKYTVSISCDDHFTLMVDRWFGVDSHIYQYYQSGLPATNIWNAVCCSRPQPIVGDFLWYCRMEIGIALFARLFLFDMRCGGRVHFRQLHDVRPSRIQIPYLSFRFHNGKRTRLGIVIRTALGVYPSVWLCSGVDLFRLSDQRADVWPVHCNVFQSARITRIKHDHRCRKMHRVNPIYDHTRIHW
jgi:hypothetical protein